MKRLFKWLFALILILGLTFLVFAYIGMKRLDVHRGEMRELEAEARVSGQEARALLDSGHYDLKVVLNRSLLQKVLGQLEGMENTSSKGNRILIREVDLQMGEGFVKLHAQVDFHWRLGWYRGPVESTWYGFVRLLEDGRCHLDLRIAEARPMNNSLLSGSWLESWLVLKLQRKLKFPEITLPLNVERDFHIPEVVRQVKDGTLTVTVPGRTLPVHGENPSVLATPEALILLVGQLSLEEDNPSQDEKPMPEQAPQGDLQAAFRLTLLQDLLAMAVAPDKDVLISAEHIPDAWRQEKRVLGIRVKNRADLHDLSGHLNITRASLAPEGEKWLLELAAGGEVFGTVKGKAYGVSATVPFHATPSFEDRVPVRFEDSDQGLMIKFDDHPLVLDLKIVVELAGRTVTFNHPIKTSSQELFQPMSVPDWYEKEVKIPVRVFKKKVVETRDVALRATWSVALPQDSQGALIFDGVLEK